MAKMITKEHNCSCEYGCCGAFNSGTHRATKRAVKRALKSRDRQAGKAECHAS